MSRLQLAAAQIAFARNYTLGLLDQTPEADWYRQPPGCVTHVAWQVGHIAFAQYRLALWRIRDARPEDDGLFSQGFIHLFGPDSVPTADLTLAPAELRATLDRVNDQMLRELPGLSEDELDRPVPHPHAFAKTKLAALLWCGQHELVHAGQIGLLRRLLGYPPVW